MSKSSLRLGPHPVLGHLCPMPRPMMDVLGDTGFDEFVLPAVRGLARVEGGRLDILAIDANRPGQGDGGRFLAACMDAYSEIRVLHITNPRLEEMLARRGFEAFTRYEDGEVLTGMRWTCSGGPS